MSSCAHTWKHEHYQRCPHCEGERNRDRVEALRSLIAEFKALPDSEFRDRDARKYYVDRLRDLGHPDVDGLVAWKENA